MINLIFDGNNLFHKSLYVYSRSGKGKMLADEQDQAMFIRKNATDLAYTIRKFSSLNRVIVTFDKGSWRKQVEIEENDGYKANRTKDGSAVDWEAFGKIMDDFNAILNERGFISSSIYNAEGDDLMYLWGEKILAEGEDVIIVSGDRDITQCVKLKGNNFIAVFDNKSTNKKIFVPNGLLELVQEDGAVELTAENMLAAMSDFGTSRDDINAIFDEAEVNIIDPRDVLWEKTLCGDGGDNVPSVWSWKKQQKNGEINCGITGKRGVRIREILESKHPDFDVYNLHNYATDITKAIEITVNQHPTKEVIANRLRRNLKLVWLNDSTIPNKILESFEKHYHESKGKGRPKIETITMQTILEGTKYYESPTFEADIFAKTKRVDKQRAKIKKSLF